MSIFIEREFLKRITETSEAAVQAVQLQVSKDLFLDPLNKKFFEIALWYYQKYTHILTLDTLKHVLERSKIKDDERQKLLLFFSELQSSKFESRPISFLADGLRYDFKKAQLRQILISSVSSLEQSKVDETFEIIKSGITKLELNSRADTREGFFHDSTDERLKRYLDIKNYPEKYKGIGTGWPSFDRTTGGVRGGQLMVIVAGPKEGKCLKDCYFLTEKYGLITPEDIQKKLQLKPGGCVPYKLKLYSKDGVVETSHFYNDGLQNTFKLQTRFGYELEGTPEHPLLIINKDCDLVFKKLRDIVVGDKICIQRGQQCWGNNRDLTSFKYSNARAIDYSVPSKLTLELAGFLGYLVSEGRIPPQAPDVIGFSNANLDVVNDFQRRASHCFKTRWNNYSTDDYILHSSKISAFLQYCGFAPGLSGTKEIPNRILAAPKEIVVEFLRAYFEGDGSIESSTTIGCYSKSEKLIKQLQVVLGNFGIICKRRWQWQRATNTKEKISRKYWRLVIRGKNTIKFAQEIGFISREKNAKLQRFVKTFLAKKRKTNVDVIPYFRHNLVEVHRYHSQKAHPFEKASLREKELRLLRGWKNSPTKQVTYDVLPSILAIESPHLHKDKIRELVNSNFFFDTVTSKKKARGVVYDFVVPEVHNFTSNCFISHNSTSLINITHHACAVEMKNVLFASIEMKKAQVERRFESRDTGLNCSKIRDGKLSNEEEKIYNHYLELQKTRPGKLYILDEPYCTSSFIKAKLATIPLKFDLIVVDYLGILKSDSRKSNEDLWETIGNATLELRNVAREFDIPVVTATQANREGIKESRYKYGIENVGLSHLITAHCDTMLSLRLADRDELEVNDVVEINAATIAVRDDKACRFTIDACFNTMTMKERELVLTDSSLPLPVLTQVESLPPPAAV